MTPKELYKFLLLTVPAKMPICIVGRPGIGKTDVVNQACATLKINLLVLHPAIDDPIDYKGLPGISNGLAEFLLYGNLRLMMEATEPTVIFFDDLGQASEAVQKALMQLLLSRSLNGRRISDHIVFVAATNRKEDKAGVSGLLEPVKSRFVSIVDLDVYKEDWIEWSLKNSINEKVIAFVEFRPNLLVDFKPTKDMTNSCCPRTLSNLSRLVDLQLPEAIRLSAYQGAIGHAANEFTAFESMADSLVPPREILNNPGRAPLPDKSKPDLCYATAIGLSVQAEGKDMPALVTYIERMSGAGLLEYAVLCMRNLYRKDETIAKRSIDWITWTSKHHQFIV